MSHRSCDPCLTYQTLGRRDLISEAFGALDTSFSSGRGSREAGTVWHYYSSKSLLVMRQTCEG